MSDKINQPSTAEKSAKPQVKFVMPRKWAKDWRSMEAQDAKKAKVRKFVEYAKTKGAITDV